MNKTLLVTVLVGAAAIAGVLYASQHQSVSSFLKAGYKYENDFRQFQNQYGKQYAHDEGFYRYSKFAANMEIINSHNALYNAGQSTYQLGVNQLADMDLAEYKAKLLGYKPQQKTTSSVDVSVEASVNVSALPASVDWTTKGAVVGVKNQGQCGSCWAFSAVGALEGLNFLKNGRLVSLSEQTLVDCSGSYGNNGCNGGLMDYAFRYVAARGIASESAYPYKAVDGTCKSYTSVFKNTGYRDVTANSESALLTAIAQQPVSVAIEADTSAFQLYSSGILNTSACGTNLDHGVLAVGYGSNFYKIRNSWGTSWGERGYVRLARLGNGAGQCGLQKQPSYPTA